MNQKTMYSILGLNPAERRVMNTLDTVPKNASFISQTTKISNSTLTYMLKKLQRRQLICSVGQGHKHVQWKSNLEQVWSSLSTKNSTSAHVFNGKKEIFKLFDRLHQLPKNSRLLGYQPDKSLRCALRAIDTNEWLRIDNLIKERKFIVEAVVHKKSVHGIVSEVGKDKASKIFDSFIGRLEDYVCIPDGFGDFESELYIFGGSAYFINWKNEVAVEFRDKALVDMVTCMLYCLKGVGVRYSQNMEMHESKERLQQAI